MTASNPEMPSENFVRTFTRHVYQDTISKKFCFADETSNWDDGRYDSEIEAASAFQAYCEHSLCLEYVQEINPLIYLAAPYTDTTSNNPAIVEERMTKFIHVMAILDNRHLLTVSPLQKHHILNYAKLPGDWNFWQHLSRKLLSRSDIMGIVKLNGWERSAGVTGEIEWAQKLNILYCFLDEEGNYTDGN